MLLFERSGDQPTAHGTAATRGRYGRHRTRPRRAAGPATPFPHPLSYAKPQVIPGAIGPTTEGGRRTPAPCPPLRTDRRAHSMDNQALPDTHPIQNPRRPRRHPPDHDPGGVGRLPDRRLRGLGSGFRPVRALIRPNRAGRPYAWCRARRGCGAGPGVPQWPRRRPPPAGEEGGHATGRGERGRALLRGGRGRRAAGPGARLVGRPRQLGARPARPRAEVPGPRGRGRRYQEYSETCSKRYSEGPHPNGSALRRNRPGPVGR